MPTTRRSNASAAVNSSMASRVWLSCSLLAVIVLALSQTTAASAEGPTWHAPLTQRKLLGDDVVTYLQGMANRGRALLGPRAHNDIRRVRGNILGGVGGTNIIRPFTEPDSRAPAILQLCSSVNDLAKSIPVFCGSRRLLRMRRA